MGDDKFRYAAFISYSHADEAWGRWLQHRLERYRVPSHLIGRQTSRGPVPDRIGRCFRDQAELSAASNLGESLQQALRDSSALIIVCSPRSASSRWVNEEIKYFRALGRGERIYALIVDGEPNARDTSAECFPPALVRNDDGTLLHEPLAADARGGRDGKADGFLKVVSGLIGVGFDELRRREQRRRTRLLIGAIFASLAVAGATTILAITAYRAQLRAEEESAQSKALSDFLQWDLLTAINSGKKDTRQLSAAKALLDAGASQIGERLASQPVAQAKLRSSFSLAYAMLGFRDEQTKLERENTALTKRLLDAGSPEAPEVGAETIAEVGILDLNDTSLFRLNDLAHAKWPATDLRRIWVSFASLKVVLAQGDYARARQLSDELEAGLKGADRNNDDFIWAWRAAQYAIGAFYAATGDYARMESLYRAQVDELIQAAGPDTMVVGTQRVRLAVILMQTGRLDEAEELLNAGLRDLTAVVGADNQNVVLAKIDFGLLRAMQGRYADAQAVADPAFALLQAQGVKDDFDLEWQVKEAMALQEEMEGRLSLAETHLREVLALRDKHDPPESLDVAANRIELANVLREQERVAEARGQMRLISASTIVKLESAPPKRINLRRADGMLALAEGHRDQALTELREALQLSQKIYSDRSYWTIRLRKELAAAQGGLPPPQASSDARSRP